MVNDGVPLTYEEELCKQLEEEARLVNIIESLSHKNVLQTGSRGQGMYRSAGHP